MGLVVKGLCPHNPQWNLSTVPLFEGGGQTAYAVSGLVLAVLVFMATMRQEMRTAYLEPYFRLDQLQSQPQWDMFAVFVVTLLLGLAAVGWLISLSQRVRPMADRPGLIRPGSEASSFARLLTSCQEPGECVRFPGPAESFRIRGVPAHRGPGV